MTQLKITQLPAEFGAEIVGLEPKIPLDDETIQQLRAVFDQRSLIVFRDIDLDLDFQAYLSEVLIGADPFAPDLPPPANFHVSNEKEGGVAPYGRLMYHSDSQWSKELCHLLSLYGEHVEQPSVPTMFVSSAAAWDSLPDDLRSRVKDRFAIHMHDDETYNRRAAGDTDVLVNSYKLGANANKLPVAFTHPRTGRTLLYVSQQMTHSIDGMTPKESEELLEALFKHTYAPGKELAHHWREGDLVMWDNLALQHARPNLTMEGPARTLRKTIAPRPRNRDISFSYSRPAAAPAETKA